MGPRLGGPSPSTPGWIILVLWGPGQGSRRHSESRGGQGRPLRLRLAGTDHEEESALLRPHLPAGVRAAGLLSPRRARAKGKRKGGRGWIRSLEPPRDEGRDELEELRRRERELLTERDARNTKEARKEQKKKKESEESKETTEEEKKKKKKKKSKDKNEELLSERHAGRAVQKELSQLYAGTALDPVYAKETKAKALAEKYPGALAMETLKNLLTTAGEDGDLKNDPGGTPVLQERAREESDKGTVDLSNRRGCLTQKGGRPQRSTSFAKG